MVQKNSVMKTYQIIQGGMGAAVSTWQLARCVSQRGELGVVSSTAIDLVMVRILQDGDEGGHIRRALSAFPDQNVAKEIIDRYFIDGGKSAGTAYVAKPMIGDAPGKLAQQLIVAGNFVEVYLAKQGQEGSIGINFLQKIQAPVLAGLYGAMLAGVDVIIVGAGIPLEIPAAIDALREGREAQLSLFVHGASKGAAHKLTFDPTGLVDGVVFPLKRPQFFPVVSSVILAAMMVKKCAGRVDGLIIENPLAGGHNAPPRGKAPLNNKGEPIYGPRDEVDMEAIRKLGVPFWLAGAYGSSDKLQEAREQGAEGVQLGTVFAFCEESGLRADLKSRAVEMSLSECVVEVFKDPLASPTGFPFQVLKMQGTLSEPEVYAERCRQCDLGYLREPYEREDGSLGWRCRSEDPASYVKKGGKLEDTVGRKCLCNGLMANIGLAQVRKDGKEELPLVTCGEDFSCVAEMVNNAGKVYSADDVLDDLLMRSSRVAD